MKGIVTPLRYKIRLYRFIITVLYLLAATGLLVVAVVAGDAIFMLSQAFREHVWWLFVVCLLPVMLAGLYHIIRLSGLRTARWIETRDESVGNVLTNAVQLASAGSHSVLQDVLRNQAVELGRRTAGKIKLWPYMRQAMLRAVLSAVAMFLLICVGYVLFDNVVAAVLPRLLDPSGDHPPYSRLKFTVSPGNTHVLYGKNVDVRVTTNGRPVEHLYLVADTNEGSHQFTMFLSPDHTYFQTLSNLLKETEYYVTDGRARSRRFTIGITYTPEITEVQARIKYPEHTGLSEKRIVLKDEPLKLPAKTEITIMAASNRPLSSGSLTITPVLGGDVKVVPMQRVEQGATVVGNLNIDQSVLFSVTVTDLSGLESAQKREGRIDVLPDKRPRIYVLEPGRHAVATPESLIPVHVQAEDDYAVDRIFWFRGINQSIERPGNLATAEPDRRMRILEAKSHFDLKDLGVRPGDVLDYFFEAVDNNPEGPNVATSRIYSLQIISVEQYQDILRQQAASKELFETYEMLGNWLRRLAERVADLQEEGGNPTPDPSQADSGLTGNTPPYPPQGGNEPTPDPSQEGNDALKSELDTLAKDLREYRKALEKVLAAPTSFDIEVSFHQTLGEQLQQLKQLEDELSPQRQERNPQFLINRIAEVLKALTEQEHEQIASPVQQIKAVVRLMSLADKFVALTGRQEELVRFARRFSDQYEVSRIQRMELMELGSGEQHVRDDLAALFDELPKLIQTLPKDDVYEELRRSALQFLYNAEGIGILSDLEQAASGFSDIDGPVAYPLAVSALEKMQQFISTCNAWGGQEMIEQCLRFQPSISNGLGNTLQQILAAMSGSGAQGPASGYTMIAEQVSVYGPESELFRTPLSDKGDESSSGDTSERSEIIDERADEPDLEMPDSPGRVKLMKDMKFPARYRKLIGDYFRKISEEGTSE